ncbi:MAG: glycosyltransferase family 4 protein [Anaerolineae bacterium]
MRILMLAQFYPPIMGGEENYVRMLSIELAARGHSVAVATLGADGSPDFEVDNGVRVYRLHGTMERMTWLFSESNRRHAPPFPDPELLWALRDVVERERPQIVHAHNWLGYQYLPLKSLGDARYILHLHDMSLVCARKDFMYHGAVCSGPGPTKCLGCAMDFYGSAKGVVTAVGNAGMAAATRAGIDMFLAVSHATAMSNGLVGSRLPWQIVTGFMPDDITADTGEYDSYLAQLPSEDYLMFAGGLRKIKGIDVLLEAYADLPDAPPLVLIGYQAADTPAEFPKGVTLLKNWPHGAVMAAWRRSLMGLVPSICADSFPLVMLEAMISGRPVVASRIGGVTEGVVDGETGLLVPPGDARALRDAIQRLVRDPALRERMGLAARRRAEQFRASAVVPRVEAIYQNLIQGGRALQETELSHSRQVT